MPIISRFYGIIITMYYEDHPPPHFHARYHSDQAKFDIRSGSLIIGSMPFRARTLVEEWRKQHGDVLLRNWELARKHDVLEKVEPLR
jgi:Domain of unknown function (DUF4160)